MRFSIVIPAYNEQQKIASDIEAASEFLDENNLAGQVIVADDGSTDHTTRSAANAAERCTCGPDVEVIRNKEHRGKGCAVRTGISRSSGDFVMFADSGSCVPLRNALMGMKMIAAGDCDIAHGSRRMKQTRIIRDQGIYRHICSLVFHWFAIHVMRIPPDLTDTQCGFKIYRGDVARHLYGECITDGFMFDIEVILRALKEGYRIREFPIEWTCDLDSRLSPTRSSWRILSELWKIRAALRKTYRR